MAPETEPISTDFAPAARSSGREISEQHALVSATAAVRFSVEIMPLPVVVLNEHRQIVFANEAFVRICPPEPAGVVTGLRPGEALHCHNADKAAGGCGTTEACRTCGVVKAILAAGRGQVATEDCRISTNHIGGDLNVRVWTRPFDVGPDTFTVLTLLDISHEKRREALERIFFHDLLNTAGNVRGICGVLPDAPPAERHEFVRLLECVANQLIDQIEAQRDLIAGEQGELGVNPKPIASRHFLDTVVQSFRNDPISAGRAIRADPESHDIVFSSDPTLLGRVLGNMTKNALEGCPAGGTVTLSCAVAGDRIAFRVHNPAVIPREVQLQMFQRFFSTKGQGTRTGDLQHEAAERRLSWRHGGVQFIRGRRHDVRRGIPARPRTSPRTARSHFVRHTAATPLHGVLSTAADLLRPRRTRAPRGCRQSGARGSPAGFPAFSCRAPAV